MTPQPHLVRRPRRRRATPAPRRSRPPGATPPTSSSPAPARASSGCSTRRPTCCSTPTSRAAYDATLDGRAAARRAPPVSPGRRARPAADGDPKAERRAASAPSAGGAEQGRRAARRRPGPRARLPARASSLAVRAGAADGRGPRGLAGVFGLQVRNDARVADARDEAPAAAERAAKALLAYDYRTLPADRKRARAYLTDGFRRSTSRTSRCWRSRRTAPPERPCRPRPWSPPPCSAPA